MNSVELYQLDINNRSNRIGGYAPINSIVPPAVQRNPEVMGFPVSQERREPRALAFLLPLRRQGGGGKGVPTVRADSKDPPPPPVRPSNPAQIQQHSGGDQVCQDG